MSAPVITFLNNKGGVGKTSLVYHLAWMLSEIGERVLVCDLDPQANLTASFLSEGELESLWGGSSSNRTIFQCVAPLVEVGDIQEPCVHPAADALGLIPGDLALSGFEDHLASEWPNAYEKWVNRMPESYARCLMDEKQGPFAETPARDKFCIATVKHYRSLVPMAQEARKPIFELTSADGAIGAHAAAVGEAHKDFRRLAKVIRERVKSAA